MTFNDLIDRRLTGIMHDGFKDCRKLTRIRLNRLIQTIAEQITDRVGNVVERKIRIEQVTDVHPFIARRFRQYRTIG